MTDTKFKIGHVLIRVNHLSKAVKDFEDMGFTVIYGGKKEKARNAMIYFQDGSFLELFCISKNNLIKKLLRNLIAIFTPFGFPSIYRYLMYLENGEGLTDWALDCIPSSDYDSIVKNVRAYMSMSKAKVMERKGEDDILVRWQITIPKDSQYPFFMSPYTPEINRPNLHSNGIVGIKGIHLKLSPKFIATSTNTFKKLFYPIEDTPNKYAINMDQHCFLTPGDYRSIAVKKIILKSSMNTESSLPKSLCHGAIIEVVNY